MDILRFICSTIVLICTGVVLSGDTDPQAKHYSNLQVKTISNPSDPYANGREITMDYEFSIPLLNFNNQKHEVRAVAR